jgi:hypothetical protein
MSISNDEGPSNGEHSPQSCVCHNPQLLNYLLRRTPVCALPYSTAYKTYYNAMLHLYFLYISPASSQRELMRSDHAHSANDCTGTAVHVGSSAVYYSYFWRANITAITHTWLIILNHEQEGTKRKRRNKSMW